MIYSQTILFQEDTPNKFLQFLLNQHPHVLQNGTEPILNHNKKTYIHVRKADDY